MSLATPLPPRPRRREWLLGGLAAGLLLGVFERALGLVEGVGFEPALAMVLMAASALLVTLPCALLGLLSPMHRLNHSGLVGAACGAIVGARPLGAVFGSWLAGTPLAEAILGALPGLAVALAVGAAAAWAADRLERVHALLAPPLPFWALVAFLAAAAERRLALGATWMDLTTVLVAAVALLAFGALGLGAMRLRVGRLGRTAALAAIAAFGLALGPRIGPWLWNEPELGAALPAPPSLLLILVPGTTQMLSSVELLAASGMRFEAVRATRRGGANAQAFFRLPDGSSLLAALHARGYRSAAILADPRRPPPSGIRDVRVRESRATRLAHESLRTAGGPTLLALDRGRGLPRTNPSAEVTQEAIFWLLAWRSATQPPPFVLLVDYRREASSRPDDASLDRQLTRLLEFAEEVGVAPNTQVAVVEDQHESSRWIRAVVRPPGERIERGERVRDPVPPEAVAAALLRGAGLEAPESS